MCTINSLLIRTDVTCVQALNSYVLAGIGGQLHIFDKNNGKLEKVIEIFDGQKIYGIEPNSSNMHWLFYGGKRMKVLEAAFGNFLKFVEVVEHNCRDWILEAKWIDSDNIISVFMHNVVAVWSREMELIRKVVCEEKCILYSAHVVNKTWNDLIVLSGTVFSQILIWWPSKCKEEDPLCPVLHKLDGHKGVIFSVHYNPVAGLICSTSDDRSAILWSVSSKDLLIELAQSNIKISFKCSLYGHSARVFRCKVLNNRVITAGEDSLVNIWDFEGNLLKKIEAHQGSCVWSLGYNVVDDTIITGGGDCGLTIFPSKLQDTKWDLHMNSGEVPKRVVLLKSNNVVAITENGKLQHFHLLENKWTEITQHFHLLENKWTEITQHLDLVGYALLEVSPCRCFISLAGYHGTIYIYKQIDNDLRLFYKHATEDKLRIFAFHWLSSKTYLTCGPYGIISLWHIEGDGVRLMNKFTLPPSKERWTTAACLYCDKYIVVGDRKGNIYLYQLDSTNPIQIMKKAHNYLGITSVHVYKDEVISLGRNSELKRYKFDEAQKQLTLLSSDKLPFSWLAALCPNSSTTLLLAFFGDEFVVWDYKERRTLLQYPCGGGHRSWDFYKNDEVANFVYIKDKQVHLMQFLWTSLCPNDIITGHHVNEINTAYCINISKSRDQCWFISGGEDTTLRISLIKFTSHFARLEKVSVLKSHLSSIRTVAARKISEGIENSSEKYLFFSAGGRAQIVLWELQISNINISCSEIFSYYEPLSSDEAETRVMDLLTVLVNNYVILIAAYSDGLLKIFFVDACAKQNNYEMLLIGSINYKLKCILKLSYLEICSCNILLSMATDGKIAFWNITEFIQSVRCFQKEFSDYTNFKTNLPLNPLYFFDCHQSGINSFAYKILTHSSCLFLSGGDDNAIVVDLIQLDVQNDVINIKSLSRFCDAFSHCAQITGVFFLEDYFLTTSIDQKLNVFKYDVMNDNIQCKFIKKHNCAVADIQGMQCFKKDSCIIVVLYGKGIEICKVQIGNNTS